MMANSLDPDETARDEPSHLDLHCLHRYLYRSTRLTGLNLFFLLLLFFDFSLILYHKERM